MSKRVKGLWGILQSLHELGNQANRLLQQARKTNRRHSYLGNTRRNLFYKSGGTEGNNWVMKGTAIEKTSIWETPHSFKHRTSFRSRNSEATWNLLGYEVSFAPVTNQGFVDVQALGQLIKKKRFSSQWWLLITRLARFNRFKKSVSS